MLSAQEFAESAHRTAHGAVRRPRDRWFPVVHVVGSGGAVAIFDWTRPGMGTPVSLAAELRSRLPALRPVYAAVLVSTAPAEATLYQAGHDFIVRESAEIITSGDGRRAGEFAADATGLEVDGPVADALRAALCWSWRVRR